MMRISTLLAAALALAACHAGTPPEPAPAAPPTTVAPAPASPAPTSDPVPTVPPPPPAATVKPGDKCGDGDACPPPMQCASYRGIAGARGPLFKTCEIKCDSDAACTDGRHCRVIADGPGKVCR